VRGASAGTINFGVQDRNASGFGDLEIYDLSVKEIAGNHASQATSASRPVLRARYNSLLYSETFSNAAWQSASSGTGVAGVKTPNFGTAPDGTLTACRIQLDVSAGSAGNQSQIYQNYTAVTGNVTYQCYVKTNDGSTKTIMPFVGSGSTVLTVTGTWQLFTFTRTSVGTTDNFQFILIKGTTSDTADLLVWHPQSNPGSSAGTYQRIAAATVYDTAGFLPYLALSTDDSMATGSIDFTATDKMAVVAGVTKNSDASAQIICELSATSSAGNNGSFAVISALSPSNYAFYLYGTALASRTATTYASPITNVLSVKYDISQSTVPNEVAPQINGVIPTLADAGGAGTGNFGNYPLYIGRRNNATLPFDGRIYQMIVVGKTLSASELASAESFVATKTGVTL
jgi:hypothetical protein